MTDYYVRPITDKKDPRKKQKPDGLSWGTAFATLGKALKKAATGKGVVCR